MVNLRHFYGMLTKMPVVSSVNHPIQEGRSFKILCMPYSNSYSYNERTKTGVVSISPTLLHYIINLINPKPNLSISIIRGPETQMILKDSDVSLDELFDGIMKLISNSVNANLSVSDANEILRRLELIDDVYLVKSDGSECLVVFEKPNPNESCYKKEIFRRKLELFRGEVRVFNESRTVIMTPEEYKGLSKTIKEKIEFCSTLPDNKIQVVFRREAIENVVRMIKIQVKINKYQRKLRELELLKTRLEQLKSSSE
jgi:hypothetical protein